MDARRELRPHLTNEQKSRAIDMHLDKLREQGFCLPTEVVRSLSQLFGVHASEEQIEQVIEEANRNDPNGFGEAVKEAVKKGRNTPAFKEYMKRQRSENTSGEHDTSYPENPIRWQPPVTGPIKKRDRSGKIFSEVFSNEQIYTLLKLHESIVESHGTNQNIWRQLVAEWKQAYPSYLVGGDSLVYRLKKVYSNLDPDVRLSGRFKAAMDENLRIPKRQMHRGTGYRQGPKDEQPFDKRHVEFLKKRYQDHSVPAVTELLKAKFKEMEGVTPREVKNLLKRHGLRTCKPRGNYTTEQKVFLAEKFEASAFKTWNQERRDSVVRQFCEQFNAPNFTTKKLVDLEGRLRGKTVESLRQEAQRKTVEQAEARQNFKQTLTREYWRRQLDIEIFKAVEEKGPDDRWKDLIGIICQTPSYQKNYEARSEPDDNALRVRKKTLDEDGWTIAQLEEQVAKLMEQLQPSEDESDDNGSDDDDESDGDNDD